MGEAQRQRALMAQWVDSLSGDEKTVFNVCQAAFGAIITELGLTEGCYFVSFFLTEYLSARYNIIVGPIVGYINDGKDEAMISHAWIEYQGKKCDLTLVIAPPQPKGPLLILDKKITRGLIEYTYHLEKGEAGQELEERLKAHDPNVQKYIEEKVEEHKHMLEVVKSSQSRMAYLTAAPENRDFDTLSAVMDTAF